MSFGRRCINGWCMANAFRKTVAFRKGGWKISENCPEQLLNKMFSRNNFDYFSGNSVACLQRW